MFFQKSGQKTSRPALKSVKFVQDSAKLPLLFSKITLFLSTREHGNAVLWSKVLFFSAHDTASHMLEYQLRELLRKEAVSKVDDTASCITLLLKLGSLSIRSGLNQP